MANTYSLDLESGSSQYASIADASQTGLDLNSDFTFECWVKFESHNYFGLISKYQSSTNKRAYALETVITAGAIYRLNLIISSDGITPVEKYIAWAPSLATWYHIAVAFDISAGTAEFYINGSSIGSVSGLPTSIYNNDQPFTIGQHNGGEYFDGMIDDVRLWSDIRSVAEISANYKTELTGSEANLVGYWKFNNSYLDETSNNNDLTASGSPVFSSDVPFTNPLTANLISYWKLDETSGTREDSHGSNDLSDGNTVTYDTGKISNAAQFTSGNSEYLYISDASQTGLDPAGSFSISMWVKPNSVNGRSRSIIARDVSGDRKLDIGLYASDSSAGPDKPYWYINDTSFQLGSSGLTSGTWYHLVFVYTYVANGTSKMDMYINGSSGATQITNAVGPMGNSTHEFSVGRREYSGSEHYYDGLIDEVGYWGKALTSDEVTSLYNGGSGLAYPFSTTTTVTPHLLASTGVGS